MRTASATLLRAIGVFAGLAITPLAVSAHTYLIDFNSTATSGGYPGGAGTWNVYRTPNDATGLIRDTTGVTSSIRIGLSATGARSFGLGDSSQGSQIDPSVGGPDWLITGPDHTDTQAGDYFFTHTEGKGDDSIIVTFSGLEPGSLVAIDLWMGRIRDQEGDGRFTYSLDGGSTTAGFDVLEKDGTPAGGAWSGATTKETTFRVFEDGRQLGRYMSITGLEVSQDGTVVVTATDAPDSSWTGIAALRLRVSTIPEPSTYVGLLETVSLAASTLPDPR